MLYTHHSAPEVEWLQTHAESENCIETPQSPLEVGQSVSSSQSLTKLQEHQDIPLQY